MEAGVFFRIFFEIYYYIDLIVIIILPADMLNLYVVSLLCHISKRTHGVATFIPSHQHFSLASSIHCTFSLTFAIDKYGGAIAAIITPTQMQNVLFVLCAYSSHDFRIVLLLLSHEIT